MTNVKIENLLDKKKIDRHVVTLESIESFGNEESLRAMLRNIKSYSAALKQRITLINNSLTAAVPFARDNLYLFCGYSGHGKCFSPNTQIMMYDGTSKAVQDIRVGDLVMGPDSKPRRVLTLASGIDQMYEIVPTKGDPYVVNSNHVLALTVSPSRKIFKGLKRGSKINIPILDYLASSKSFKASTKGYRAALEFALQKVDLDPYFLGYWLGDGCSYNTEICTADSEVISRIEKYANRLSKITGIKHRVTKTNKGNKAIACRIVSSGREGDNYVLNSLRNLNLLQNKHIPRSFLNNSREVRLQVLAGLVDSDGSSNSKPHLDFIFKNEKLADDVVFLCRSLGFAAYKKVTQKQCKNSKTQKTDNYFRVSVSGDLATIPTIIPRKRFPPRRQNKNVLNVGISVRPVGLGQYYGFSVDGDHLFLLSDFTVVHNSTVAANIAYPLWKQKKKILVISNEEPQHDVLFRIACLELNLSFNEYKKGLMPKENIVRVFRLFEEIGQYVKVVDSAQNDGLCSSTLEGVQSALNAVINQDYSCVLIDYFQNIKRSVNKSDKSHYEVLDDFREWLGHYIHQEGAPPVAMFVQLYSLTKRGGTKGSQDLDNRIKMCSAVVEPATVIIEMIPNFDERLTTFIINKDRFGNSGKQVICAFERGRFIDIPREKLAEFKLGRAHEKANLILKELKSDAAVLPVDSNLKKEEE